MATPNASGSFALVLQYLKSKGYSSSERVELAEGLLESTSFIITNTVGTPLSPRRQGAGLIDLSDAVTSHLVITDPLLELGDSTSGVFTGTFQIRNLSDQSETVYLTPTALTDAYAYNSSVGSYSLLSPLDITDNVTFQGLDPVTVPAGGTAEVTVTITVSSSLRQELSSVYPNGFFTEGYIEGGTADGDFVHVTFLGYCGDWQAAPIVDQTDFRDVQDATAYLARTTRGGSSLLELGYTYLDVLDIEVGANLVYVTDSIYNTSGAALLGENPYAHVTHSDKRNALASQDSDALYSSGYLFTSDVYTLRNAAHLIMVVSDQKTGEIYYVDDTSWLPKAKVSDTTGQIIPTGWFYWDGTDADGKALAGGTQVMVRFYGWLDSNSQMQAVYEEQAPDGDKPETYRWLTSGYDQCLQWSFPITIDGSAPTLAAAPTYDSASQTLTVRVKDDQFLAYVSLSDGTGKVLAEETFADESSGQSHTLTVDLKDYSTLPDTLYLTAQDYASNRTSISIDLSAAQVDTHLCAMFLLTDVELDSWYHDAVDYVYTNGIMTGGSVLAFQPGDTTTRAEVVTILYRLAGSPEVTGSELLPFTDVSGDAWYRDALTWAYQKGLANGVSATSFAGTSKVTRQELAAFLQRYVALIQGEDVSARADLSGYTDAGQVAGWAAEAMEWAVSTGLINGRTATTLAPLGSASRAEAAQMLTRFLQD
jgi:hypothetical protein